jgi:hypothetical protein
MMVDAGVPLIAVVDDGIGFDAKSSRGLGLLGMEERLLVGGDLRIASQPGMNTTASAEIPRSVRNSVCGVSKSRPTRSDHDKEIAKLERELRDIDVAIAALERLEANSSSKGKGIKTPKSRNLIQMKRRPRKR